ncbi:MAG: hypothetical protein Q8Q01_05000 [archaeon]|nr:hypothetical protein [archaeon]
MALKINRKKGIWLLIIIIFLVTSIFYYQSSKSLLKDELSLENEIPLEEIIPDLYAGYSFALSNSQSIGNTGGFVKDKVSSYYINGKLEPNKIYLSGSWKSNPNNLEAVSDSVIFLDFTASEVLVAASPGNGQHKIKVTLGGEPLTKEQAGQDIVFENDESFIIVDELALYSLVNQKFNRGLLQLELDPGIKIGVFSFG